MPEQNEQARELNEAEEAFGAVFPSGAPSASRQRVVRPSRDGGSDAMAFCPVSCHAQDVILNKSIEWTLGAILQSSSYKAGRRNAMDLNARVVAAIAVSTGSRSIDDAPTNPTAAHRSRT